MPFRHGKNTAVFVNDADLTAYFNEATVSTDIDTAETTTFGNSAKNYVVGLKDATISLNGLFDGAASAYDVKLSAILGVDDIVVTVVPEGKTVGNRCWSALADTTSYEIDSPVDDVVSANAEFNADGGVDGCVLLFVNQAASGVTNSTSQNNGASTANGGAAYLHVTANTRDGSSTIKVQHSADNTTWADLATFQSVAASATFSQRILVTGTVNQYVRAVITPGGASGSITATVTFGRR